MTETNAWDLVIIGGGTAGLVASRTAASFGARAVLIEDNRLGGDCLWTGCVPSKSLISRRGCRQDGALLGAPRGERERRRRGLRPGDGACAVRHA